MKNSLTSTSDSIRNNAGQSTGARGNQNNRIIYPAIVREVDDSAGYNRIKAEIVNLNDFGQIYSGKDKDLTLSQLPLAIPLLPEFMHVRPKVGECVLVILENPTDPTSARYYIGPLINQQTKLDFQSFQSSQSIYNRNTFKGKDIAGSPSTNINKSAGELFATQDEIAFQGRKNSDIVFGDNTVKIRTGIFNYPSFEENTTHPCKIELKIVNEPIATTGIKIADSTINKDFKPFSQQNIIATNINIFSPEGKFRNTTIGNKEVNYNQRLNDFGDLAKTLHPAVLGDELVGILNLIINYMFTHVHTPQSTSLPNNFAYQLEKYRNKDAMSALILSNVIRIN